MGHSRAGQTAPRSDAERNLWIDRPTRVELRSEVQLDEATIYHITTAEAWRAAREASVYTAASLKTEGFIHCSTQRQVAATASRYFPGATNLVVLCVDVSLLRHDIRYEDTSGHGQLFPHIYGPLDLVAVRSVVELTPGADGTFVFDFDPAATETPHVVNKPFQEVRRPSSYQGEGTAPPSSEQLAAAPERVSEAQESTREVRIVATNYDGSPHWSHPARLVHADDTIVITETSAGLPIERAAGPFTSPFNTRAHYWPDRYFNVIRLEEPGRGLTGYYCNIAAPVIFDGANVSYVDLQLDVRVFVATDGTLTWALLDEDEFEAACIQYSYDDALIANCRAAVDEIIAMVEAKTYPFDGSLKLPTPASE
jgi:uncharacterized protein (DUF952 family)/protein associated with RNAse G/E